MTNERRLAVNSSLGISSFAIVFRMLHIRSHIDEAVAVISARWSGRPRVGIILGSGLGGLAEEIQAEATFDYAELPHFPRSTALGHAGLLICGRLAGVPVVAMQGRFHLYEGYSAEQVTLPVRVMTALGVELLVVSNAAGGLDPAFCAGDVMVIEDQINLMFRNPLVGINDDQLGPRFPDMCGPYEAGLIDAAMSIARQENFVAHRGVYVGMLGPTYETRAEYRMLRRIGGHAVGMSTVPEVIAAVHGCARVLGLSIIANVASPDAPATTSGAEVVAVVEQAGAKAAGIVRGVVTILPT